MNQIFRNIILFFLLNVLISSTDQNSVSNLFDFISIDDKQNQINFEELKDKINDLNNIIRRQDNKILHMNYKADSLKIVLFEHLIAFDEYKRDAQSGIARLEGDLKSATSRRKSDDTDDEEIEVYEDTDFNKFDEFDDDKKTSKFIAFDEAPVAISGVKMKYPPMAKAAGISFLV